MYFNAVRSRMIYFLIFLFTIVVGLLSRIFAPVLPYLIATYSGDIIWGFMVFIGMAIIFKKKSTVNIVILALLFSFSIEYSQLLDNPTLNSMRSSTLGGLVLGHGFLISDLVCYVVGIGTGAFLEVIVKKRSTTKK